MKVSDASLDGFFSGKKLIVCVGTGGVGKTTSVAMLGIAAAKQGKRTLLITVDPSQRLATSLGLRRGTSRVSVVKGEGLGGRLHGVVNYPTEVFDNFLRNSMGDDEDFEKMSKNRLYDQLRNRLGGSQEFTSLEMLYEHVFSGEYDLVILDTPPAQNAIDFFEAPEKIHALFDSSVTKWFLKSEGSGGIFKKLLLGGSEKVLQSLQALTGVEFISELKEFFQLAQGCQEKLSLRMKEVYRLLSDSTTSFVLVTSFDEVKLVEAARFERELKKKGYRTDSLVVNRVFPEWLSLQSEASTELAGVSDLREKMSNFYQSRRKHLESFRLRSDYHFVFQIPDLFAVSTIADIEKLLAQAEIHSS